MYAVYIAEWIKLRKSFVMKIFFWFMIAAMIDVFYLSVSQYVGGFLHYPVSILSSLKNLGFFIPAISASYIFSRYRMDESVPYSRAGIRGYLGKMMVLFTLLTVTSTLYFIQPEVRDLHSIIVFMLFIPLFIFIGVLLKNPTFSVILQVIACWIVRGLTIGLQQQDNMFNNYLLSNLNRDMAYKGVCALFLGSELSLFFTKVFVVISITSLLLGMYVYRRYEIKGKEVKH